MSIDIREVTFDNCKLAYSDLYFVSSVELVDLVTDGESLLVRIRGHDEAGKCIQLEIGYEELRGIAEQAKSLMQVRIALHESCEAFRGFHQ